MTCIDHTLTIEIENASYLLKAVGVQIANTGGQDSQRVAELLKAYDL